MRVCVCGCLGAGLDRPGAASAAAAAGGGGGGGGGGGVVGVVGGGAFGQVWTGLLIRRRDAKPRRRVRRLAKRVSAENKHTAHAQSNQINPPPHPALPTQLQNRVQHTHTHTHTRAHGEKWTPPSRLRVSIAKTRLVGSAAVGTLQSRNKTRYNSVKPDKNR